MKKRITSLVMAIIMLLGVVMVGNVPVRAEETVPVVNEETVPNTSEETVPDNTEETVPEETVPEETVPEETVPDVTEPQGMTASDECLDILKAEEGFSRTPYWDFTQYTVGYGTRCPSDMVAYYTQNGITEQEAEVLLRNSLTSVENDIRVRIIDKYGLTLAQNQFDALVLFSYNCGTNWTYDSSGTFHTAIAQSATGNDLIRAFALWCSAGNQIRSYLLRRRLTEANMYLNNLYSTTPPENYCYVLYDANGGVTSPRSQGYNSDWTAAPFPVPTYAGYTFLGWFTAKTGGTKVTVLDASTKNTTLFAQWADAEGNAPPDNGASTEKPVTVTVTGSEVNLRQGPGTNYTRVGTAKRGEQFIITEIATGTGYTWGKFEGGWIALAYTNYDAVISGQVPPETTTPSESTDPETTVPETTVPETTVPETTVPETTVPETTVPETTVPETTVPETTAPETTEPSETQPEEEKPKLIGIANVNQFLRIRSGPGTSYSVAGYLKPQQQVEILEQKIVGGTKWARIAEGWVSMDYIILSSNTSTPDNNGGNTEPTTWTGKVIADELLIRSGPATTYSIVSYLKNGTSVTITEKKSDGTLEWGKIENGWICLKYVQLDVTGNNGGSTDGDNNGGGNTETKPDTLTGTVNVNEFLRVRSGPGTSYSVAGYLKPKDKVTITQRQTVGNTVWGKIDMGWISLDYVILDKNTSNDTTPEKDIRTVTADLLRVRKAPGTENAIVDYLYYGTKVEILEIATASNGGKWGRITSGWIYLGYTK